MTAPELKPCPFCGGEASLITGDECAYVQCLDVKMHRGPFIDGDNDAVSEAAAAWNRRADLAAAIEPQPDPRDEQRRALERVIRNQRTQIKRLAATAEAHWRFVNRVREERMADPRDEVIALAITACRVIDDAALEGYDNAGELLMHLLSALEPARAALAAAKAVQK